MELSSLELSNLRERGLTVVETTKSRGVAFVDRTQRVTAEWLAESERRLLTGLLDAVREIEARIQRRLEILAEAPEGAEAGLGARVDDVDAPASAALPIEDYDQYTAKEIIAELTELSADAAKAILEYEKAHKGRATVIRAAEQKLVA